MERIDMSEGRLMVAIFGENRFGYYPYIIVERDGKEEIIGLQEEIRKAMATLSHKEQKVLEFRFGLLDGKPKTLKEVCREVCREFFQVTGSRVAQIQARALQKLRHPAHSRILRQFIILSPEEVSGLRREINRLMTESRLLDEKNQRLRKILKGCGIAEEEIERVDSENLALSFQKRKAREEDEEALRNLMAKFPGNSIWGPVRRQGVTGLSELKKLLETGKILKLPNIGKKRAKFLRDILEITEKEASP